MIATRIFAPEAAAAAFRLERLACTLSTRAAVDVLTVRAPGTYEPPQGVGVRRWPVLRDGSGYVRGYLPYLSYDVPLLLRMLIGPRAAVVVVEPPPTTGAVVRLACAIRRQPYLWYAADVWSDAAEAAGSRAPVVRLLRAIESWVVRGAVASLAVSDGVADRVRELGGHEVLTVGNGVDTEIFRLEGEVRGGRRTLVYAGTASEWQGADVFARVMPSVLEHVPDARLVYLGNGNALAQIEALAASMPAGAVRVLGSVSARESAAWLRGAAGALVSIVPGKGYDFAIPTKAFAALGTGTPVLYAGAGPLSEILEQEELGRAVTYDDIEGVAAGMIAMLTDAGSDGGGDSARGRRAEWVQTHRSLAAVAARASAAVLRFADAASGQVRSG